MQQLSGLDATFLFLETPEMPMHVGALHVFALPAGGRSRFAVALRKHIAARLPVLPVLRRRLWWMPLNLANPAWVDAEPDLRWHVQEHRLPASARQGNGLAELEAAVAALHPQLLDRERPLWRFHVFEGLGPAADGSRRVALYTQLHHAAVDGQAAVALANALMDLTPEPRALELRKSRRPRVYTLGMTEMLRGVIGAQAQKVAGIVRELPSTVGTVKDVVTTALARSKLLGGPGGSGNVALAPRTPMNVSVSTGRRFATVSLPLPMLRLLGQAHGATLNDLVLFLCSTALRRHLQRRKALPRKSLVAAVPVTLRAAGDTTADNQASMSLVSLGTHIADTGKRLAHVQAATAAMKATMGGLKKVLPTDFPSLGVPWLLEAATALYGRAHLAERIPQVANLVISNVPGPPVPLYLAGARMLSNHPCSIVVHGLALNITVQSYDTTLDFGLMADAKALPELPELAEALRIAWDDLLALPRPGESDAEAEDEASVVNLARRGVSGLTGLAGRLTGSVTGAMTESLGRATRQVVGAAVGGAVQGAMRSTRPAPAAAKPKTSPRRAAPSSPRKPR